MGLWKWFLCVGLLSVALSDTVPERGLVETKNDYQQLLQNKLESFEVTDIDFAKIFPNHQEKLNSILKDLSSVSTDKEKVAILNDYTDECLVLLNNFLMLNSVDPLPMEDMITGFEFRFLFITYWAEIGLRNGWLQGVASMERRDDVILKYEYPYLKVHSPLGFNKLMFAYDYNIQFMGLGPKGGVDGSVNGCRYTFDLSINLTTLRAKVERFKLDTLGSVNLKFNGYIWFDWFVNLCVKFALIGVKPILRLVIQAFSSELIHLICDTYNSIICQILGDCHEQLGNLIF